MLFTRRLVAAIFVAVLVLGGIVQIASAQVINDPGGGGRPGGGGSGGSAKGGDDSGPKRCDPYLVSSTSTPVRTITPESQPYFTPTGRWEWVYDYADEQVRVEGYEDRLIKQEVQKYDPVGRDENDYYIIDFARPTFKNTYQKIEHRSGRFTVSGLTWAPVYSLPLYVLNKWSDCIDEWYTDGYTTGGPLAPIREWGIGGFPKYYDFPADNGTCPVEVPGVRPAGAPPFVVLQCEVVVNTFTRIEPGKELPWAFGGKPISNPSSGTRGGFADVAVHAIAQGAPGGKQRVDSVRVRVLAPFPDTGWQYLGLWSGNQQDGIWRAMIPIPRQGVMLRPHRYVVEAEISGFNFWGARRIKTIRFWLVIDEGEGPDDPQGLGPCGGLSEDYMRSHPNWLAHCSGSRLIK